MQSWRCYECGFANVWYERTCERCFRRRPPLRRTRRIARDALAWLVGDLRR